MLPLPHEFLLLALHDDRGTHLCADEFDLKAGVAAAFLGELMFRERLVSVAAHQYRLIDAPPLPGVLGEAEEGLRGKGPGTLEKCMGWLRGFWGTRDLEGWLTTDLEARGILRREQDRILFIPYRTRHPAQDMTAEKQLIQRLRQYLHTVRPEVPPTRDDALISLLRGLKLLDSVWSEAEQQRLRSVLVRRTRRAPLGRTARKVAYDYRMAAMAAAVVH